jgi:hypothetical protein
MRERLCPDSRKRCYKSAAVARRAGSDRFGTTPEVYRCTSCGSWHVTRRRTPEDPAIALPREPLLDRIIELVFGIRV